MLATIELSLTDFPPVKFYGDSYGAAIMTTPRLLRISAAAACLVLFGGLASKTLSAKDPERKVDAQLQADIDTLKAGVTKKAKNSVNPLKSLSMLIALQADDALKANANELSAGTRDTAMKIAKLLAKSEPDWDGISRETATLSTAKGDPTVAVKFDEAEFDVHELMTAFKPKNRGGLGLENTLKEQVQGVKDARAALAFGNHIVLIGRYSELLTKTLSLDAKAKTWISHAQEMQKVGGALASEAAKADKADKTVMTKAAKAIELNCTTCHKDFRN